MKQALTQGFLIMTLIGLSACDKGGGDNKKDAVIPGPNGQIRAYNDNQTGNLGSYCQVGGGTITCYSQNQFNPYGQGQQCQTSIKSYSDIPSLCARVYELQNEFQCNVSMVLQRIIQENCAGGVGQQQFPQPTIPGQTIPGQTMPLDPNYKTIQCEFEAYRVRQGRWIRHEARTPKITTTVTLDSRVKQEIDLRSRFLTFDIGNFGRTSMIYTPAGIKGTSDKITLVNKGLSDMITLSQSGFAGQEVRLDAQSDDGQVRMNIACSGKAAFRKNAPAKAYTKYVCTGKSFLMGAAGEDRIEVSLPYNSSLTDEEIMLAEGLTARVTGDSSGDNARVTFTALGVGLDLSVVSSAYMKTPTALKASDGVNSVDVTCTPQ